MDPHSFLSRNAGEKQLDRANSKTQTSPREIGMCSDLIGERKNGGERRGAVTHKESEPEKPMMRWILIAKLEDRNLIVGLVLFPAQKKTRFYVLDGTNHVERLLNAFFGRTFEEFDPEQLILSQKTRCIALKRVKATGKQRSCFICF